MRIRILVFLFAVYTFPFNSLGQVAPFTSTPLTETRDLSELMVKGIDKFLLAETDHVTKTRSALWRRDFSSVQAFQKSIASQRKLLSERLGVIDQRIASHIEVLTNEQLKQYKVESEDYIIYAVRWNVLEGLPAEGLLVQPKGKVRARLIMLPDADVLPEVLAGFKGFHGHGFNAAIRAAKAGSQVLIPTLVSREDRFSGSPLLGRFTNQPHREWIYRQAYEVGRHVIGYELQKIFAAVDWFISRNKAEGVNVNVGIAGHGEGGLLALYAAALDERISSTIVSGYFDDRQQLWREPIYRNVFGVLKSFGDAELAVMSWPRTLIVEYAKGPEVPGPPPTSTQRSGAAPGRIVTPALVSSKAEFNRAKTLLPEQANNLEWIEGITGTLTEPFSDAALKALAKGMKVKPAEKFSGTASLVPANKWITFADRQERTVRDMEKHVQHVLDICDRTRKENFWNTLKGSAADQQSAKSSQRERFWNVLGKLPDPTSPANPKARKLNVTEKWTSYEITLDVFGSEVFAWGILIIPNDIRPGEKRPAIVCQHGLEGVPMDAVTTDSTANGYKFYKGFATKLAERGYITFSPHNPYRGGDTFRTLQRKANPLGFTLFSVIISQHQRILEWLMQQSFIDPARIGFYGLSYGGKTAMRVPAVLEGYALSICSADFNEWVRKVATNDDDFGYLFTGEYDMPEWDLGHTFNYAEMAALIAPRPFMVERGYYDNVGIDEWVDYEFAKVQRHFFLLGSPNAVRIEHFVGPHTINGIGTFEFLDHHLKRP
ncbi:MAG TPA: alpha/beta hydrolase family protein [Flavitalea sp.]|nr:alpha/beta hydrolase family protein [Flavitalea sp.]